jgi:hypothetical protein
VLLPIQYLLFPHSVAQIDLGQSEIDAKQLTGCGRKSRRFCLLQELHTPLAFGKTPKDFLAVRPSEDTTQILRLQVPCGKRLILSSLML